MNLFGIEVAGKEAVVVGVEAKVSVEFSAKTVEVFQKPKEVKQDKPKGKPILLNKDQL